MSFNPFDKPIGEKLEESDLEQLVARKVSEGFFIEFKRELPKDRQKIGNSIASFANTYGGWYIVGVETDGHNVASSITGFSQTDGQHDPIAVITETLKTAVDPTPLFHSQVINLGSGRLVAAVFVSAGQATPFITRDGRIYRRTHDSSAPLPETSRHALDELIARGRKEVEAFRRFASDDRGIEEKFDRHARVSVYISPSPHGVIRKQDFTLAESVAALLEDSRKSQLLGEPFDGIKANVPLDTALIRQQSILLRQVHRGGEPFYGLSIELDVFGRCRITLPLRPVLKKPEEYEQIRTAACRDALLGRLLDDVSDDDQPLDKLSFFDISHTWLALTTLTAFYLRWLEAPPAIAGFDIAVEALAVGQHVPFCDDSKWAEHVKLYGLPVTLGFRSRVPEFAEQGWFVGAQKMLWGQVCSLVGRAFGLPTELMTDVVPQAIFNSPPPSEAQRD